MTAENDWLTLREKVDRCARSEQLACEFAKLVQKGGAILDLGCGTGANYRYLQPILPVDMSWHCFDCDATVLAKAGKMITDPSVRLERLDLAHDFPTVPIEFKNDPGGPAITMSAFLDLTSLEWMKRFVAHFRRSIVYVAMTPSASIQWIPRLEADDAINQVLIRHQRKDHGFGPALGLTASQKLAGLLQNAGHRVTTVPTNWQLDHQRFAMLSTMITGIARRVRLSNAKIDIDAWQRVREQQLEDHQLTLTVPHLDLLAVPSNSVAE
jgi:hypothetical protein